MGRSTVFSDKDNKYPALHSDSRNEQNRRLAMAKLKKMRTG